MIEDFLILTLIHEILGHVKRVISGLSTNWYILSNGTAYYLDVEEGFSMYLESIHSKIFYPTRLHLICGHIIAIDIAGKSSFYDVFKKLKMYHFSNKQAFEIALRVKSGFIDTSKKGVYTRSSAYLYGYLKVKRYINTFGNITDFYIARCGIRDFALVKLLIEIDK